MARAWPRRCGLGVELGLTDAELDALRLARDEGLAVDVHLLVLSLPLPPPSPLPCLVQRALLIIRVSARHLRARGCASAGAGRRRNARDVCTRRVHTQGARSLRADGTRRWWNACGCMSWLRCLPYAGVVVLVPVAERAVEAGIRGQHLCVSGTRSSTRAEVVIRLVHDGSSCAGIRVRAGWGRAASARL